MFNFVQIFSVLRDSSDNFSNKNLPVPGTVYKDFAHCPMQIEMGKPETVLSFIQASLIFCGPRPS
jgi:hypothetical protein